jgi:PAS domain-containing protein
MPWVESLTDPEELRHCIRDLVVLSTLPAIWINSNPQQIADSVAAALLSMLAGDFVYVVLPSGKRESVAEAIHVRKTVPSDARKTVLAVLRELWAARSEQTDVIISPFWKDVIHVAAAPVGIHGDGVIVAGSEQPIFPTEVQRLLLSIGANTTTTALEHWSAETEEARFVSLVERSSDFVGVASLDGVPRYVNPAGLELVGLTTVKQLPRLHVVDFLLPEDRARVREECWPTVMQDGRWRGELVFTSRP